jgi:hypothetical protein
VSLDRVATRASPHPSLPPDESASDDEAEDGAHLRFSRSKSWHDNWLFCQRRSLASEAFRRSSALLLHEPVAMLVPNPNWQQNNEDDDYIEHRVMIGDRDVDELSELSERQSVASLELSESSLESDVEETATKKKGPHLATSSSTSTPFSSLEGGQQTDLEHTEYAVLPMRRLSLRENTNASSQMPTFAQTPKSVITVETGRAAKLECTVRGAKPIGK